MPVPPTFRVLDTLPLARALLPLAPDQRVGTLAECFGCARPGAHHADVDVEMLGGIVWAWSGSCTAARPAPLSTTSCAMLAMLGAECWRLRPDQR